MKAHAFLTVTGTCLQPATTDPRGNVHDLVWIVATCLTPAEASAVRCALINDMMRLLAAEPTTPPQQGRTRSATLIGSWLKNHAVDPYLALHADEIAFRIACGFTPTYDVYRSYDDFSQIAELVTGEETST